MTAFSIAQWLQTGVGCCSQWAEKDLLHYYPGQTPILTSDSQTHSRVASGERKAELLEFVRSSSASKQIKRQQSAIILSEKAVLSNVSHRLHDLSPLQVLIQRSVDEDQAAAKKSHHLLQRDNQRIVARAEKRAKSVA